MMNRRQMLMMLSAEPELYPIGTDIVQTYIRDADGWQKGYMINSSGEYVTGNADYYGSNIYIPISPDYSYSKNGYRLGNNAGGYGAWYDKDYQFISSFNQDNTTAESLPNVPSNAAYLRVCTRNFTNSNGLKVTRTA